MEAQVAIKNKETGHYDAAAWEANSALIALTTKSTVNNDYDLKELEDVDIKSPKEHQTPSNFHTKHQNTSRTPHTKPS